MPHHEHPYQRNRNAPKVARVLTLREPWKNEYKETTTLLEAKLLNHVRLNSRIRDNLGSYVRLLWVTEKEISVNLNEFTRSYQKKFIEKDFESYCIGFIQQLDPLLQDFLAEIQFDVHFFRFRFSFYDREFEKLIKVTSLS